MYLFKYFIYIIFSIILCIEKYCYCNVMKKDIVITISIQMFIGNTANEQKHWQVSLKNTQKYIQNYKSVYKYEQS